MKNKRLHIKPSKGAGWLHPSRTSGSVDHDIAFIAQGGEIYAVWLSVSEFEVNANVKYIFFIFRNILHWHILHILHGFNNRLHFTCFQRDEDDWHIADYRTGSSIPLRADRWYQQAPGFVSNFPSSPRGFYRNLNQYLQSRKASAISDSQFGNLWQPQPGFKCIQKGNNTAWYTILKFLPDKIAWFLH